MRSGIRLLLVLCLTALPLGAWEPQGTMRLGGPMGERFSRDLEQWLTVAPYANPGMVEMYFRRNAPHPDIQRWYGEFSGKYLTGAALNYAMCPDPRLKVAADYVTDCLSRAQDADGYLGVWPDGEKLTGVTPKGKPTWDLWSHYHNMLGLYFWYKVSGKARAREVLLKAADCLCAFFEEPGRSLEGEDTRLSVGHIFAILYRETGEDRYLKMAGRVLAAFENGGDFFRDALRGIPFFQMKSTRWECLHAIQTLALMYRITGEECYLEAFHAIWESIRSYDRHNTGAFSSAEHACGDPFDPRSIETCCTIAWMALCVDMLDLSDDPRVADELELTTWNAFLGAQHPSGRYFTYDTPMDGERKASAHQIVFQALAGSPELNCCSANGPRGFGMIGQWGVVARADTLTVNWYGASETSRTLPSGRRVTLVQEGEYPFGPRLTLTLDAPARTRCCLRLRIPAWSSDTRVWRNGKRLGGVHPGTYLVLDGVRGREQVVLEFDLSPHFWRGEGAFAGAASLYAGPILLACDQRYEPRVPEGSPALDLASLTFRPVREDDGIWPQPFLQVMAADGEGRQMLLCDFASAGATGTPYISWILVRGEGPSSSGGPYSDSWLERGTERAHPGKK